MGSKKFSLPPPPAPDRSQSRISAGDTKAGARDWNDFCRLYATAVQSGGRATFWPLGFIPGPALLTVNGEVVDAEPGEFARGLGNLPKSVTDLDERVRQAMSAWTVLAQELGYSPTPWEREAALWTLNYGRIKGVLVLGMLRFRYRSGDPEVPLGIVLEETGLEKFRVAKVYNPERLANVPGEETVLSYASLKGEGPAQKLLRTWALVEKNFSSRYYRNGSPRRERREEQTTIYSTGGGGINSPRMKE
ncbi:MAG: hypothetical protein G01um101430_452 [Parcubacteria group bacterium Gr01-1014_30]|nr:MAG: hypothetical protein G01um101430_452 [Parcubacteria group bacterium Gr01-1014_30]